MKPTEQQGVPLERVRRRVKKQAAAPPPSVEGIALAAHESGREQHLPFARLVHGPVAGGMVYASASKHLAECNAFQETAQEFTADFIRRVAPQDPLEELLAIQMLHTHARAGRLTTQAAQQRDPKKVKVFHEAADAASNTFRKLMLGLAQYRRPPRGGDTFMAIRQTNVAEQQVVQNQVGAVAQGVNDVIGRSALESAHAAPQAALPPVADGAGVTAEVRIAQSTVVEKLGAAYRGREGAGEDERVPARRPVRRIRRAA